jgi:small GTP-binding protein
MQYDNAEITLLDTPGHVDFSAETERTLQVLDYAILEISGTDGVQSHTQTLWKLLQKYGVPVFIFVNKTDLAGVDKANVLEQLKARLSDTALISAIQGSADFYESVAVCDEALLNKFSIRKG